MNRKTKTAATKEEATPALVPKLRFPEFRDGPSWDSDLLGNLAEMRSGGTPPSSVTQYYGGDIPWVSIADMTKAGKFITSTDRNLSRAGLENCSAQIFPVGTVIFAMYASIGECAITRVPLCSSQAILGIRPSSVLDNEFLYCYLTSLKPRLKSLGQHGTQANLNKNIVQSLMFPLPALAEQQKIAECLSSVDELMAAQARKVDTLKTHKKGLMQQLFPREGETQPRLRFPEFQNAGEWVEQSIGDFGKVVTGSTPSTAQPAFYGGGIPFASPADISDMRFVDQTKTTLTAEGFAETRPIRAGSVLFVCIGSTIGKVAQNVHDCATNQQINTVVPSTKHSDGFVYYALSFASERIALLAGRQAVPIINKSLFSSVRILAPKLPEQERIAKCLSSLDALITAETQKHEALKTHKKGLMQQLFPSPVGVEK